jgi:hypothetical protein
MNSGEVFWMRQGRSSVARVLIDAPGGCQLQRRSEWRSCVTRTKLPQSRKPLISTGHGDTESEAQKTSVPPCLRGSWQQRQLCDGHSGPALAHSSATVRKRPTLSLPITYGFGWPGRRFSIAGRLAFVRS